MKLFILLLALSFLSLSTPTTEAKASDHAVFDTDGEKLRTGDEYYILPVIRGSGGGLTLGSRNDICPLFVAQSARELDYGIALTFSPVNTSRDEVVPLSTDLNIDFAVGATICVQSTVWRLDDVDEATGRRYVVTGGVEGNPGVDTVSNWFKIERSEIGMEAYKFVFCPSVCDTCKVECGDLGVFYEGVERWLGLNGVPFRVAFKKKNSDSYAVSI